MSKKPNPELVDDDIPELTNEDFARAVPLSDLPESLQAKLRNRRRPKHYIPHEIVSRMVDNDWKIVRAWREHLGLSAQEVAARLDVSTSVYEQLESTANLPESTRQMIAAALGIDAGLLDV